MPTAACPDCTNQVSTLAFACPNCGRPFDSKSFQRVIAKPDWLLGVTCVAVVLASLGAGLSNLIAATKQTVAAVSAKPIKMTYSGYSVADHAAFTFTNLTGVTGYACVKGVITSKKDKTDKAESVPVCTGELAPHATIILTATYPAGSVQDMCSDAPDRFGIKQMNWANCTFETVDVTGQSL